MKVLLIGLERELAEALAEDIESMVESVDYEPSWQDLEQTVIELRPDAAVVRLSERPGTVLSHIRTVRARYPAVSYIALIDEDTPEMVQAVADAGCTDLVVMKELPKDLRRALRVVKSREGQHAADGEATFIMGAKGGVGTGVIASNLAAELAGRGRMRVVLVDLHLYMGDLAVSLDVRPNPSVVWFLQQGSMADARTWAEAPPEHRTGFRLLGLTGELEDVEPVTAEQVVFLVDRLKSRYDHVILDVGSEINEVSLAAASAADRRWLVITDTLAARAGARRRLAALRAMDASTSLILNRADKPGESEIKMIEDFVGEKVLHTVSNDWQGVQRALERGQIMREFAPRSPITRDFAAIADALTGADEVKVEKRKRTLFSFFR